MRIGLLCDNNLVTVWQARAIAGLAADDTLFVYNCRNGRPNRKRLRHALYYALNLFTIRNPLTRAQVIPTGPARIAAHFDFEAEYEGIWQRLPEALLRRIEGDRLHVLIKFGMNLLRVPERGAPPILSYHHGDPDHYRGRPAGFYELLHGRDVMGQIVQILSNELDAGKVVASAETKVHAHSYRATLMEAFTRSPLLLRVAIRNAQSGTYIPKSSTGRNYRLPSNGTVLRFIAQRTWALARRLVYGALMEKAWRSSTAPLDSERLLSDPTPRLPPRELWRTLPVPRGYGFIADPFFAPGGAILAEGLRSRTGLGEILLLNGDSWRSISPAEGHHSYPGAVVVGGEPFVVPETCLWSDAGIYRLTESHLEHVAALHVPGDGRLIDPTLFEHQGRMYLFANRASEGPGVLRLWHATSLFDPFEEHAGSPVRVSPAGSRMAGQVLRSSEGLFRFGQDLRGEYGDGVFLYRIEELAPEAYSEREVARLSLDGVRGPHTLNFLEGEALFDWYVDRISPLAGVRRLLAKLRSRAAR